MDPVVENAEVGLGRADAGAENEGDLGIVHGHPAGDPLGAEGISRDQLVAFFRIFPHDPGKVSGFHALGPFVLNPQVLFGPQQGDMDLVHPWLLDGGLKNRGHLERGLRVQRGGQPAAQHQGRDERRDQNHSGRSWETFSRTHVISSSSQWLTVCCNNVKFSRC